ncbi:hypothetical protein [Alteromonas halophila]|uniref:Uncharacterized protein n=1 Tax=Alteromonas halophila TaxID=516698 RepID=A0A918JJ39_9ALTE|nr:hypothetical protein [Alteromonas halophila]GGW82859.1 hypothetical protein GCM10007391_15040 [Alteromonas halophila]
MSAITTPQQDLTHDDIEHVSGAAFIPFPLPDVTVRPPVYTTQAIGEDGGEYPPEVLY